MEIRETRRYCLSVLDDLGEFFGKESMDDGFTGFL